MDIKRRKSIVTKLFVITVLFISFCLGFFMIGQTLFFEKIYLNMKTDRLESAVGDFGSTYEKGNWDGNAITRSINDFSDRNNAQIVILDKNGLTKYMPSFSIVIETKDKKNLDIPLNNIAFLDEFQKLGLSVGAEIEVGGFFNKDSNQMLSVSSIKKDGKEWENSNIKLVATSAATVRTAPANVKDGLKVDTVKGSGIIEAGNIVVSGESVPASPQYKLEAISQDKVRGKITQLNLPTQIQQIANYSNGLLWSSIDYWNQLVMVKKVSMEPGKTLSFHYSGINNGMDNIVFVRPVIKNNSISEYVFAISSLQPVGEAVDAMKEYYLYAFVGAVLLMAAMALIFSRNISRPLLKMNRVAAKMANLDFSESCAVKSSDELGSLALSLNRLSMNLSGSLSELKAANEQLQLDIEKERSLETMRKEFVSSVSHEFKTPLGIIKGFAEGFKDNIAENKKEYYIDVILDEVEKMDELVMDLLDLARLESRVYELNAENFSAADLIDEVGSRLNKSMEEKHIELELEIGESDLGVLADRRRIEQVMTNILSNAIRHTDNNGSIAIVAKKKENEICVSVENTGSHIGEEDLDKIWDRFYRAEKSRDRKTGGTGLGLSIVKNILELHHSKYGVENTGKGVKFYFSLPANSGKYFLTCGKSK